MESIYDTLGPLPLTRGVRWTAAVRRAGAVFGMGTLAALAMGACCLFGEARPLVAAAAVAGTVEVGVIVAAIVELARAFASHGKLAVAAVLDRPGLAPWVTFGRRPTLAEIEAALADPRTPEPVRRLGAFALDDRDAGNPAALAAQLRSIRPSRRLRARMLLAGLGGDAVRAVVAEERDRTLRGADVLRLLGETSARSVARYRKSNPPPVCRQCLVGFERRHVTVGLKRLAFYACRSCGSGLAPLDGVRRITAVLDASDDRANRLVLRNGELRVNWLARARRKGFEGQDLFDFDSAEILDASDQEVRHFLVDVTSDTDQFRRKRYARMTCGVARGCQISPNTLAALRKAFGRVDEMPS